MSIKAKKMFFYSIILTSSVFYLLYVVQMKSGINTTLFHSGSFVDFNATNSIKIEKFKSKIVRPLYNVSCRQLFEMNSVSKNEINIHLEILF